MIGNTRPANQDDGLATASGVVTLGRVNSTFVPIPKVHSIVTVPPGRKSE